MMAKQGRLAGILRINSIKMSNAFDNGLYSKYHDAVNGVGTVWALVGH